MNKFIVKPNKTVAELKAIANESNKISLERFDQKIAQGYGAIDALYLLHKEDNCTEQEIIDLINSEYKNIYAPIGPERYAKPKNDALRHGTDEEYENLVDDLKKDLIIEYVGEHDVVSIVSKDGGFFSFINEIGAKSLSFERRGMAHSEKERKNIENILNEKQIILDNKYNSKYGEMMFARNKDGMNNFRDFEYRESVYLAKSEAEAKAKIENENYFYENHEASIFEKIKNFLFYPVL